MPRETEVTYGMTAAGGVTIQVDEAIFGVLTYQKQPGETYNDVVRRLLGMPPQLGAADERGPGSLPAPGPGPGPGGRAASGEHARDGHHAGGGLAGVPIGERGTHPFPASSPRPASGDGTVPGGRSQDGTAP
jgi:hypothetical protein